MCEHDSAALKARQCRVDSGLREENEPLATTAMLPRTARTARHEGARCDNARSLRHTTMRMKYCHAGRPELTRRAHIDAKPGRRERRETAKKLLCRLTLELSGAGGVRLERIVRPRAE